MTARASTRRRAVDCDPFPTLRACEVDTAPAAHKWLVESLWARAGVGLIGGTPKSCKSWLGLELATAVASGTPCLGRFWVHEPGPALVFLAEDALIEVRERLAALAAHRGILLDSLDIHLITADTVRLDLESDFRRLVANVSSLRPRLLLLDPLVRLHRQNENDAGEIAAILGRLRAIQRRYEVAITLVHHTRKQAAAHQPGQALRGSGDLHAWGDSNLYLTRHPLGLLLVPEHRSAAAPDPFHVALLGPSPHLEVVDPLASDPHAPSLDQRILDTLAAQAKPLTRTELRQRLGVNNQRLGEALVRLHNQGSLRRTPDGWSR